MGESEGTRSLIFSSHLVLLTLDNYTFLGNCPPTPPPPPPLKPTLTVTSQLRQNDPFFPALRLLPHSTRAEHLEQTKRLSTRTALSLPAYEILEYQHYFLVLFFFRFKCRTTGVSSCP